MGEVYRARDSRLNREVAVKVLSEGFDKDAARLRRFESEAKAVGSISHPNVLAIYDTGEHDGAPYLVTELLEGTTLRERLAAGPLPARKALEIATQIARGLAAAHEKGIVHRDVKPENVFITRDGNVKLLDFGIARADVSGTLAQTDTGAVIGTAGYMSPEQVRGLPADSRSDVFALGAVLFEMLTGKRAFDGDNAIARGYAILNTDPVPTGASPAIDRLVRRDRALFVA